MTRQNHWLTEMLVDALGFKTEPPKPFQMIVDRPFFFLIEDEPTRMILFLGVVFDPGVAA